MGDTDTTWLLTKGAVTLATVATVVAGAAVGLSRPLNAGSLGLTLVLLLPALIYGLGVWSPRNILVFGAIVLGLTILTWGLYLANRKESMAGAAVVMGTIWALISAIAGAAVDAEHRRRV